MEKKLLGQDCRVLVLGVGQLGRYHAEALARSSRCGEIWGFDVSEEALTAFQTLGESLEAVNRTPFMVASKLRFVPRELGLLVVATTADSRADVLKEAMEATDPQFVLLEKPLSSSRAGLEILRQVCPDNTYVNFPRRYSPLHLEAIKRAAYFRGEHIKVIVDLPWPTMLSNASHFIDIASELIGQAPIEVVLEPEKVTPVESKRRGFMDLQGEMSVTYPLSNELIIDTSGRSDKSAKNGVTISVQSGSDWLRIDETNATPSDSTGKHLKIPGTPLQSQLTGHYLEQLQVRGFLDLPTFIEALPAHELLLTAVEAIEQELGLELPFT